MATAPVDAKQWEEKVKAYHLPRAEVNKVIMEYLVKEGFKEVCRSCVWSGCSNSTLYSL